MKPVIDEDLCIGDGICEDECPQVFKLGDDGIAHVIKDDVPEEEYGCVRDAVDACPTQAIAFEE
jgi:ferredoxin